MIALADSLKQLYDQVLIAQGLQSDKQMIEIMKRMRQFARDNAEPGDVLASGLNTGEDVESGTETESGRTPRIALNLSRPVLATAFLKQLNEQMEQPIEQLFRCVIRHSPL